VQSEHFLAHYHQDCCQRKAFNNPPGRLSPANLSYEFLSIQDVRIVGEGTTQHSLIVVRIEWRTTTMPLIISTLSFLYTTLSFIYSTFLHIPFSHHFNFFYLSLAAILTHHNKAPHFSSYSSIQLQEKQTIYPGRESEWWKPHNTQQWQSWLRWH
jgi:hypothetical protein